ncbi:histidine kinase [Cellulomonas fimi]|uniref:sensor histidine kinase n=1 Tax=Cellulomonas fimi TaxID=1708 RepID=UPI00234DC1FE|nr:histidine kinase [Cellulomonas fimi]MDC7123425.1 histidine kinase [Cellulomonas fimi]
MTEATGVVRDADVPAGAGRTGWWDRGARLVAAVRARGWWDDRTVALGTLLFGLVLLGLGVASAEAPWVPDVVADRVGLWHVVLLVVASTALVVKRRHPVAVLLVTASCAMLDALLGGSVATLVALFDALYTAALLTRETVRRRIVVAVVVLVVLSPVVALALGAPGREAVLMLLQSVAVFGTPLWWAHDVRRRDELAALESDRAAAEGRRAEAERQRADAERAAAELARAHADDLARIADLDRESAVREERARTARDLHDVVAGHVSAVAIRAEAALAGPPDPDADREALRAVRAGTLDALAELRSMIVVLRGRPDAVTAPAGLDRLEDLLRAARAAGQRVVVDGPVPAGLAAATDHAAFRIVQEALTNAAKHAPHATTHLVLDAGADALDVTVSNATDGSSVTPPLHGGTGLLTMRERAEALGGTLDAGERDGTWTVRAHLPAVVG